MIPLTITRKIISIGKSKGIIIPRAIYALLDPTKKYKFTIKETNQEDETTWQT